VKITTDKLFKTYKQGAASVTAVRNVTLSIPEKKLTAITGTSGCGKTSLLNMLGGLVLPTSGKVYCDGTDLYRLPTIKRNEIRRSKFGYVFQNYSLIPMMTALENICVPSLLNSAKPDMEYIRELCDILRISERLDHLPSEMSGGEQQRASLARALSHRPEVLLADEPTGSLDKTSAETLLGLLLDVQRKYELTIVMVTHDANIASQADYKLEMNDGFIDVKSQYAY